MTHSGRDLDGCCFPKEFKRWGEREGEEKKRGRGEQIEGKKEREAGKDRGKKKGVGMNPRQLEREIISL